jgi:hypothetical protein
MASIYRGLINFGIGCLLGFATLPLLIILFPVNDEDQEHLEHPALQHMWNETYLNLLDIVFVYR